MNIKRKLSQKFVIDKIKATDWKNGTTNPLIVELDTTEVCDLVCPGCISEDIIANNNSFTDKRLMEIGKDFYETGVKAVILIGGGEPLAHPSVGKFMDYLGEHDIHIGITTNGTFIHRYMDTIAKYSSWTRVSMDAATDETFMKLRPGKNGKSKFDKIVNNMRELAKIKKGKLGFSYLIRTEADGFGIESNINEIYNAAILARDIGCDYFEVKPSYNYDGDVDHSLVQHSPKRMQEAKIEIDRLSELETDTFKISIAINLKFSLEGAQVLQPKGYKTCPMTELRATVCPSGVFVCPYWRGKERYKIGNIIDTSIQDIWNSTKRKDVIEFLDVRQHCSFHCLRDESNLEVFKMIELIEHGENIEVIDEYDRFI